MRNCISADLSRASSVLDYTSLPTTSSPFPSPSPRSKAQKRTSVQQANVARQLKSMNSTLRASRQRESRISGARMLKSWDLIILSSSIRDLLRRNRAPQAATGCQGSGPRIHQISLNRCSRLHRSAKGSVGCPGYSSGAQMAPGPRSRHQRWSKVSKM